ncbi:MAG: hypothetical protein QM704_01885 [Anaeromyxobacteraceae bacterium]
MRTLRTLAFLLAALPWYARAGNVQVTSSTQYVRDADFLSQTTDQHDIAQYLRLSATFGEAEQIGFYGYGRLIGQLSDSVEPRRELADNLLGRLYYLYLDYRDAVPGHLDVRAGRTYVGTAVIPAVVDGAQLVGRDVGVKGLGMSAFGGHRVYFSNLTELPYRNDSVWGASLSFEAAARTRAELSFAREYRSGDFSRQDAALDVSTSPMQALSLFGRAKYDTVSDKLAELDVGAKVQPIDALVLRAEYLDSVPTFEKQSFYRSFGVERYRQVGFGAEVRLAPWLRLTGKYAWERFDAEERASLVGGGFRALPAPGLSLSASYEHRDGYAGRLGGLRMNAAYTLSPIRTTLLAGVDYDDFTREASRDGSAKRYWLGAEVKVSRPLSASVRLERVENFLFDRSYQGFVAVDYHP